MAALGANARTRIGAPMRGRDHGRIRDKDTVPPGRDPNPPKDAKH